MSQWDVLFVASLTLLPGVKPALAAGYYNLGANLQPPSPVSTTEVGYISGTAEAADCPTGTWATGLSSYLGWVTSNMRFICSDGSSTTGTLGGSGSPNASSTCSGAGNDIASIQLNTNGYMQSICYIRIGCRDGTMGQLNGSGAGGCGTWQSVQTCPQGYAITGGTDHYNAASTYFASLSLTCRYTNRSPALIGYWPLSETSGTSAADVSGNSNTGTYQTGTTLNQTGVIPSDGKAVLFNGTSGYMSTATSMTLMAHHSISVWFKTTSATKMGIFGFENLQTGTGSTSNSSSLETETDGRLTFYFWNGTTGYTITTTGTYKDGNWHHVVASIGLAGTQLWVDGSLVGQNTSVISSGSYAGYWRLGYAKRAGAYFNGSIDNFAVYKGQLTSSEVEGLYEDANLPYLYPFTTHTFTNASITGRNGPTLAQVRSAYSSQAWAASSAYLDMTTQGVQIWTVPETATYTITAAGAAGGNGTAGSKIGGPGRVVSGDIALTKGDKLYIVAGQLGESNSYQAGGGGGSFVYLNSISASSHVLVAGGGGGATHGAAGVAGSTTASGIAGTGTYGGAGGTSGGGGNKGLVADGSAGTGTNGSAALGGNGSNVVSCAIHGGGGGGGGTGTSGAATFIGGLYGSATTGGQGGFGAAGAGGSGCSGGGGGGGGGGYSGGGGGSGGSGVGGGGGSNSGGSVTNYNSNVGTNTAAGYVTVTKN